MIARSTYTCQDCFEAQHVSLAQGRRHAREACPVWSPERQSFRTHGLIRDES